MKFIFCVVLLVTFSANAQKNLSPSKIPMATKNAFTKAHPNAIGKWEKEGSDYEVNFKNDGKTMSCVIDKTGTIKETETDIAVNELPIQVSSYIAKHYKGAKVKEAATIQKADGTTVYEAEIRGKDVLFDAAGNVVSSRKNN